MITNKCGVYKITNTVTGDCYIGSSSSVERRCYIHQYTLTKNTHYNPHLQNAWNKYGIDCFVFSTLECCEIERVIEREQFYIDNEKPRYNICQIAGSSRGTKLSEETKRKMSKVRRGKHHTEESKRKMSESQKGENNSNFGKQMSEEQKHKISESEKGRHCSDETLANMSKARKGKPNGRLGKHLSDETRTKISEANKGKHHTEESKRKMSEAANRRWAKKVEIAQVAYAVVSLL